MVKALVEKSWSKPGGEVTRQKTGQHVTSLKKASTNVKKKVEREDGPVTVTKPTEPVLTKIKPENIEGGGRRGKADVLFFDLDRGNIW